MSSRKSYVLHSEINLWFEDDLFCQVNFWFVAHLLDKGNKNNQVYLVRPQPHTPYSFGGLKESELMTTYHEKTAITELHELSDLWGAYQNGDTQKMHQIATKLADTYPFILQAVEAHIQRIPKDGALGRPMDSLRAIINELKTEEFGPVFKAFSEKESIYGFGDLQVKRLYDQLKNSLNDG
ncbi:MAG: hypothetical protein AAGA66_03660 [Bacteroidota bacterium]